MIALLLLLAAQASDAAPSASPAPAPPSVHHVCRREPGSDIVECKPAPQQQQQLGYRLAGYGPGAGRASRATGVTVRAQTTNRARRNRSTVTLGIPF